MKRYDSIYIVQITLIIAAIFITAQVMAQSDQSGESMQSQVATQSHIPKPGFKPEQKFSTRTMQRTGTTIVGARNSVSIKSTDAGIIHYPPPVSATPQAYYAPSHPYVPSVSGCINCGIIDFINAVGQGNALNTMASGIVAGTIARKLAGHGVYAQSNPPNQGRGEHPEHTEQHQHYHVGITMHDGSQKILTVPDVSHLHRGDKIQLIEGMIMPEPRTP